jgi:hypothetical protein
MKSSGNFMTEFDDRAGLGLGVGPDGGETVLASAGARDTAENPRLRAASVVITFANVRLATLN